MFSQGLNNLLGFKYLLFALVKRDISGRYKGSVFGMIWSIIEPIVLLAVYTLFFGILLGMRLRNDPSLSSFALEVFCAIVIWLAITEALNRSTVVIFENTSLVKKVIFPAEILPLKVTCSALVHQGLGLFVLLLGLLFLGKNITWTWFLLPLLILPQFLLTAGISWILASVTVFIRDIRQIVSLSTLCWMFLTPIFYPEYIIRDFAGGKFTFWLTLNPAAALIHNYRNILVRGCCPEWISYGYVLILGIFFFFFGLWWFNKTKKAFVDVI